MNIKKTLFAALLATVCLGASAEKATSADSIKSVYKFVPHLYVQGQAGGQYTLGEGCFGDLLSPNAQVAVGYNFNKIFGVRLAVNAWQSKGVSEIAGTTYKWKWNYVSPTVAATANISNLVSGVNPKRLIDVYAFAGVGLNVAFSNKEADAVHDAMIAHYPIMEQYDDQYLRLKWDNTKAYMVGQGGLIAEAKVAKNLAVNVELSANFTGDSYNSKKAGNADWYFNALAGVKYTFGKTYNEEKILPPEPKVIYKEKIVEKVVEKIVEKPVEVVKNTIVTRDTVSRQPMHIEIFFNLAGFKLLGSEGQKVKEVANYMKRWPEAKLKVTGLCDKGTGTDAINNPLSEKRANLVKDILVKEYGISADRISVVGLGSTVQPYEVPELNRVAICDAE